MAPDRTREPRRPRAVEEDLPPILPQDGDPIPKPRKRGRPKGGTNGPILLSCPFAAATRGQNRCLTYPNPVEKGKVEPQHSFWEV